MLRHDTKINPSLLFNTAIIREVEMEVVFGTPSKNCSGAGICLIAGVFPADYRIPCPHTRAIIHYLPGNELVFRFRKSSLDQALVRSYFNKSLFLVEEPFSIPRHLVQRWNMPIEQIPPGEYLLEEYSSEWRLYFLL
ncbi:MAG: hypothetical protein IPK76_03820 [Lewinellaceae bacterium]|nr:hypothetical protein [Lewinellaceae bacterium]